MGKHINILTELLIREWNKNNEGNIININIKWKALNEGQQQRAIKYYIYNYLK